LARQTDPLPENQYFFRLRFRPPYDWRSMLAFLAPRATPGVELVERDSYRRSILVNGKEGYVEVSLDQQPDTLLVRIHFPDPKALFLIIERIRQMFDLNADWQKIASRFKDDPILGREVETRPGVRVPGCWDGFELAVRAILGQQVTVKGATTLAGRLVQSFGRPLAAPNGLTHTFPCPKVLAEADLRRIGLPAKRAEAIRGFARAVRDGKVNFEGVTDSESFFRQLTELPGIGAWTAEYIAMRALGEPDAFPSADLGLMRSLQVKSSRELERRSQRWRPWRAYAALYLWSSPHKKTT
jgi:AraC family transcriptional regulator, regulatory protein of adaptative response / DNA-3-methyladenine glycosylase II